MSSRALTTVSVALIVAILPQLMPRGISFCYCLIEHTIVAQREGTCACPARATSATEASLDRSCCKGCDRRSTPTKGREPAMLASTTGSCCVHFTVPDHGPVAIETDSSCKTERLSLIAAAVPVIVVRPTVASADHAPQATPPPPHRVPTPLRI